MLVVFFKAATRRVEFFRREKLSEQVCNLHFGSKLCQTSLSKNSSLSPPAQCLEANPT